MSSSQIIFLFSFLFVFSTFNLSLVSGAGGTVFNYNVTIKTASSPKFDDHDGKLKLAVLYANRTGKTTQEDFVLTPKGVNLAMNRVYSSTVNSFAPLLNITSVYLRWTLESPFNPYYKIKKPSIYFDPITLTRTYTDTKLQMVINENRKFCPPTTPIGIKHSDGSSFYPCM